MKVVFAKRKIQDLCEREKDLIRAYGKIQAKTIIMRIGALEAASNLYDIQQLRQMRLHPLRGELKGLWSIDVKHPYRIFIRPIGENLSDLRTVKEVEIVKVCVDPH